jgi:hypothetical protein
MKLHTPLLWAGFMLAFAVVLDIGDQTPNAPDEAFSDPTARVYGRVSGSENNPGERAGLQLSIDGKRVDVLGVNEVREADGPGQDLIGYLIQTALPSAPAPGGKIIFNVTVVDRETGEKGEARLQLLRPDRK